MEAIYETASVKHALLLPVDFPVDTSPELASVRSANDASLRSEIEEQDADFVRACRPRLARLLMKGDGEE